MTRKLGLDASVTVKWYLDEAGAAQAKALLALDLILIAPQILLLGMQSAFRRACRAERLSHPQVKNAIAKWNCGGREQFIGFANEDLEADAVACGLETRHAFYDCLYLVLSQKQSSILLTTDEKFAAHAKKIYPHVMLLKDYPLSQ